jgi:hypothetical protein
MNVSELKELLNDYPDTARVVIHGYEGGVNEVNDLELIKIKLNVNTQWYYGKHQEVDSDDLEYDDLAVHIEFTHPIGEFANDYL